MKIMALYPANGWRAVFPTDEGARIMAVAFFATLEDDDSVRVVPLVANDHTFAQELVTADQLGRYALLGPEETADPAWLRLLERSAGGCTGAPAEKTPKNASPRCPLGFFEKGANRDVRCAKEFGHEGECGRQ